MNVCILRGSPRKNGNTNALLEPFVKTLQEALIELGFLSGKADGVFGAGTEKAVIAFQMANGLAADGIANVIRFLEDLEDEKLDNLEFLGINNIVALRGDCVSGEKRFEKEVLCHNPDIITIDYALNDRGIGLEKAKKAKDSDRLAEELAETRRRIREHMKENAKIAISHGFFSLADKMQSTTSIIPSPTTISPTNTNVPEKTGGTAAISAF